MLAVAQEPEKIAQWLPWLIGSIWPGHGSTTFFTFFHNFAQSSQSKNKMVFTEFKRAQRNGTGKQKKERREK
jgi:hypothetical protein